MKKLTFLMAMAGFMVVMLMVSSPATAAPENPPGENLDWGFGLNASETECPSGEIVLRVMRKVTDSLDSGTGSNDYDAIWWAVIEYVQQIQVVEIEQGVFCATVFSQGSFESVGGDGPGCAYTSNCGTPEGRLEAGVVGTFQGGATNTFEGTFSPDSMRTKGSIGILDHDCDYTTAAGCSGPGFSLWLSDYFTNVSGFSYDWWGWVYHAGDNGSWVNSVDGNEGNITGE